MSNILLQRSTNELCATSKTFIPSPQSNCKNTSSLLSLWSKMLCVSRFWKSLRWCSTGSCIISLIMLPFLVYIYTAISLRKHSLNVHCCSKKRSYTHYSTTVLFASCSQCMKKYLSRFFMVGDNFYANQRLATFCSVHFIGCNSHKLNLAIENWIKDQSGLAKALKCLLELMS